MIISFKACFLFTFNVEHVMTVHKIPGHVNRHEQALKSGEHVDQCTGASLHPSTYEEVSTASMSHTGENDFGNSTPTKSVFKTN